MFPVRRHGANKYFRPYLHMYAHSDEVEEVAVINLNGVNLERQEHMEALLGVCSCSDTFFYCS